MVGVGMRMGTHQMPVGSDRAIDLREGKWGMGVVSLG